MANVLFMLYHDVILLLWCIMLSINMDGDKQVDFAGVTPFPSASSGASIEEKFYSFPRLMSTSRWQHKIHV